MEESSLQKMESERYPSAVSEEVRTLTTKVRALEDEISELKKDIHAIDFLQKKPVISGDTIAVGGFWIVAALAVIGIFF
ncbi:hypothetical protein DVB69_04765 [Sporosarcina sp. BI001-red]|uniref:hypothetical protein n=1 Tax=Sporosarcina sp. BI001-red TaxID=2282866 RepID=UPI000E22627E|nr:hypothetical protein [Sporosarcina sp. BI001-red]REB10120.1 hypothetical protein DVB69_04765 [Sporosarcina sp. BI001-red]